jgi:hypothetical protein
MAAVTVGELLGLPAAAEHALVTHILKIKSPAYLYKIIYSNIFFYAVYSFKDFYEGRPSSKREVFMTPESPVFQFLGDCFDLL